MPSTDAPRAEQNGLGGTVGLDRGIGRTQIAVVIDGSEYSADHEVAAELTSLRAEVERLTRERDAFFSETRRAQEIIDALTVQREAYVCGPDIEQWRAALNSIASNTCCGRCHAAALVARSTLKNWSGVTYPNVAAENAYGCLWAASGQSETGSPISAARAILLAAIGGQGSEGQRRGISYATVKFDIGPDGAALAQGPKP